MLQFIKDLFGYGSDPIKMDLNPPEGEEMKPLDYTSTYEEPVPITFDEPQIEEKQD